MTLILTRRNAIPLVLTAMLSLAACDSDAVETVSPSMANRAKGPSDQGASATIPIDYHLLVDQFGYRPEDSKVAVIRDPQVGYDAKDHFVPGNKYQLRRAENGETVFSGTPTSWLNGVTETSSGDRGWWFDFSSVTAPGRYFVYDEEREVRSPAFSIDTQVYKNVLKAATRMYFYQRSGFAKQAPAAEACWTDGVAYGGPRQDTEARDVTDRDNVSKARNMSGGWFDAGDTNKYVTFALQPVHQLLAAYEQHPAVFTDDFNIPESGNGIPDVLDEIKWETDWLKRMQFSNGSVALKVGAISYGGSASPPSGDTLPRFYVPACTSSTIAAAGMYAHAAQVFRNVPALADESVELKRRAVAAWKNYQAAPAKQTDCDNGTVKAGDADLNAQDQDGAAVAAAVYLFALTGDPDYGSYVKQNYKLTRPYHDEGWTRYSPYEGESLLYYTTLPGADETVKAAILADKRADMKAASKIYGFNPTDDLYRAFLNDPQYHWGSNQPRANYGNSNVDVATYALADPAPYRLRAEEILHWFHGVNPFGMVMLSNMYGYGASRSANEIFHAWFHWKSAKWKDAQTSLCGPAPGYVPGGPNHNALNDGVPAYLSPPTGQPPQKSYRDWNDDGPAKSYAVTEPAIYYQSAYVKLLAAFADHPR